MKRARSSKSGLSRTSASGGGSGSKVPLPGLRTAYATHVKRSAYKDEEKEQRQAKRNFNDHVCKLAKSVLTFWGRREVEDIYNALVLDGLYAGTTTALHTKCAWPLEHIDIVSDSVKFSATSKKIKTGWLYTGKLSDFLTRGPVEPNAMRYDLAVLDMCNGYPGESNEARRSLQAIFMNRLLSEVSGLVITISFRNGPEGTSEWLHQAADVVQKDMVEMARLNDYKLNVLGFLRNKHHFSFYAKVTDPSMSMRKHGGIMEDPDGRTALDWLYEPLE